MTLNPESLHDLRDAAKRTADFIQLAMPHPENVCRQVREIVALDDPWKNEENRKRLSIVVARLATCGSLALALIEQHGLSLIDLDHAAGEMADIGLSMKPKPGEHKPLCNDCAGLARSIVPCLI